MPGTDTPVDDPQLTELASVVLQATVNTYPEADAIALGMTEHRQWIGQYEAAWKELDRLYGIESVQSLDAVLATARQRTGYAGGTERPVEEVKGDITSLYFYKPAAARATRPGAHEPSRYALHLQRRGRGAVPGSLPRLLAGRGGS